MFLAWRLKNAFHLTAGGSSDPMISISFGGALSAVPAGVPVMMRSPAARSWNRASDSSACSRPVDHVVADDHVLPHLAVDPQLQAQVGEALQFVGVEQHQCRSDRRERRIGLALVELGLGELNVAGRDIVGDNKSGDVVGQRGLGDRGTDGDVLPDHQADFDLVVEQLHVVGLDDVVERTADRRRGLAEEGQRDRSGSMPASLT